MIFYIQYNGVAIESFEALDHKEALQTFRSKYPLPDNPKDFKILRDWQGYRVSEETVDEIACYSRMSLLRKRSSNGY